MIKTGIFALIIMGVFAAFVVLVPSRQSYLSYGVGIGLTLFIIGHYLLSSRVKKKRIGVLGYWMPVVSLSALFFVLPVVFATALYFWGTLSFFTWVLLISMTMILYFNFVTIPLVVYHKYKEQKQAALPPYLPSVSVLIPAYNEEKVLSRTIETVVEASYPDKEIIVIDDGSTDRTYQIAQGFSHRGVKIIRRPNGGKASALNHGLLFARGEIIVTRR
jgi:hypothetical protein